MGGTMFYRSVAVFVAALAALTTVPAMADDASTSSSSIYRKRVGGILWLEGTAGPTRYKPTSLANELPLPEGAAEMIPDITLNGPEFGGAIGLRAGIFTIGARFKSADYDIFKLKTAALDMGFLIRVPYVHPYIRLAFNYNWLKGDMASLLPVLPGVTYDGLKGNGGGATVGLGIRIPVIKYLSISAGVDVSAIALYIRGNAIVAGMTEKQKGGAIGLQTSGIFALTLHI